MGMRGGLRRAQYRRKARVRAFQPAAPAFAGVGGEDLGQMLVEFRPRLPLPLPGKPGVAGQPQRLYQQGVELRLDGAHGDELAIRAAIGGVEVRAVVEVAPTLAVDIALGLGPQQQLQHVRRAIDDGGIDHRADARAPRAQDAGQQAHGEVQGPAAHVPGHGESGRGRRVGRPVVIERAGQRGVVVVMAGHLRHRPGLAPAGHPAIDQPGIARHAHLRPEPQPLHDAGPHAFDQRVGVRNQVEHEITPRRRLQIGHDRALAPVDQLARLPRRAIARPLHGNHIGAEVGQMHRTERPGAEPADLHDPHAFQHGCS
ncbi:hypothetical protein D3C72_1311230 [compost metagenome]